MNILQVVSGFPPFNTFGTEVYAYNLSKELAKKHKVFVFYRINDLNLREYALNHRRLDGLEIFSINNTFKLCGSFETAYKNDVIAKKFGWILGQVNPDIVHIQHLLYLSTNIIEEAKKRNTPILFTLHDYWLLCAQGQLLKNNISACNKKNSFECIDCVFHQLSIKKNIFNTFYFLKKYTPEYLVQLAKNIYLNYCRFFSSSKIQAISLIEERVAYMKAISSKVDFFISPSQFLKRKFIEFGIPEDKIIFLPHGFNLDNFKNSQKISFGKIRFGFIGNSLPAKGVHILIKCFNKIKNDNVELKIYGQAMSYKAMLGNYLHYIKKMAKNKNIKFMGGFDNRNIAKIFRAIDVLVVPSIWPENSPLVIQEAFLAKTPVIASRIGGIPELVNDGLNGILVNPGDANDLQGKIQYIIDNPNIIEKFKGNIPEVKSIEDNAKEIEEIYKKLIAKNRL